MKLSHLATAALVCGLFIVSVSAQVDTKQRARWIKHLQLMVEENPKADILIETESEQIIEVLKEGDPVLAKNVMLAAERMLDNEAVFAIVANAVLYNSAAAVQALQSMPRKTRSEIVRTLPAGADTTFAESPNVRAKYNQVVRDITSKLQTTGSEPKVAGRGDGTPAVINDPDGYTNVRSRPDTSAPVIDTIKSGQRFMVLTEDTDWWSVETPTGKIGYMHRSRIKLLK